MTVAGLLPAGGTKLSVAAGQTSQPLRVDGVLLVPVVSRLQLSGSGSAAALLASVDQHPRSVKLQLPTSGRSVASSYDRYGVLRAKRVLKGSTVTAEVLAGGFTLVIQTN